MISEIRQPSLSSECSPLIQKIRGDLFGMRDEAYADFQSRLLPTVEKERIIGVRTPALRKYALRLYKSHSFDGFTSALPHFYYEENNLHGFLIERIDDFKDAISELERFLPYVDNWASCDMTCPRTLKKDRAALLDRAYVWLSSDHPYTVRYAVKVMMDHFLGEDFDPRIPRRLSAICSEEYYVRMALAWYFQAALARRRDDVIHYFEGGISDPWVRSKAIQKCLDSYCIDEDTKKYLKSIR